MKATGHQQSKAVSGTIGSIINIALLIFTSAMLFFAQSGLWISNVVFNQAVFTEITTRVLTTQQSRDAIAGTIVDQVFEGRPAADRLLGDRATDFVSNLLGSDISERLLTRLATTSYAYMTAPNRQDIAIDLSPVKEPLSGIISFAENRGREVIFDAHRIPDQVVLLRADELPDLTGYIRGVLAANFVLWFLVVAGFGCYLFRNRRQLQRAIYWVAISVIAISLISLSTGPFIPPFIASLVENIQFRGVVSSLTSAYLQPFFQQMHVTILGAIIILVLTRFHWVFVRIWQSTHKTFNRTGR